MGRAGRYQEVYPRNADPKAPSPLQVGMGVRTGTTSRSISQGELTATNNPLDVAIEGYGFFRVLRPDGTWAYTRAGNFRVDSLGRLVTQRGEFLDPEITVPADTVEVTAQATVLQTESATVGEVISAKTVESLPLNGRNANQLALLLPTSIF